jgi:hypothetical protein
MKKTERIMHRAPRSAARASRARTAMCVSGTRNACQEQNSYLTRTNSLNIIHLPQCVSGVSCVSGVFKFILELVSNTVLFLKKNFNSKLPDTPDTHLWNYYKPSLFVVEHPTHTPFLPDTHLTHMALFLTHTKNIELNVDRISRISSTMSTNHENRLTLRVHRSVSSISTQ